MDWPNIPTRRDLLARAGQGAGLVGLIQLLAEEGMLRTAAADRTDPLAARPPHFRPRAKNVIWLFMNGGPSQVDTWDYKPELFKRDGQELKNFDKFTGFFSNQVGALMKPPFAFRQHGESGKWVSELFPNLAEHVDKMAFIHSGYTESNNHSPALFMMNSGKPRMGFPCLGSWLTYGLGATNRSLPTFVVMSDPKGRGLPKGQSLNWSAGFLPSVYQGTWLRPKGEPIRNLEPALTDRRQRRQLDLVNDLNRAHLERNPGEKDLAARIESFELAYRLQSAAPEALAVDREPESVKELYGLHDEKCGHIAKQCLTARRLVERGVRMVQIYSGGMANQRSWDGHKNIVGNHRRFAGETDKPIAGLLADLAQRGLLEDTLVIWGGEFGRLPVAQTGEKPGRDHNPHAYTTWMAGGGIKGGTTYGATDEIGHKAAERPVHVNDLHATILHLMGLHHKELTYHFNGRDYRLTDVGGRVLHDIIA